MPNKLFIGSLSWNTRDEGLRAAFEKYGEITEAKVIMDRMTGRSRGFGFVTFADEAAADRAKTEMDGQMIDGRAIRVDFPREREGGDRPPRGGGGGGGGGGGRYRD
ncbi:MAG: RNA-binding protein [Myxococcota bacterium]|jgi:RNA recognition motif-containing protein